MRKKIGFLKKATAHTDGYYSRSGERLVSARLTTAEVEAFNGVPKKKKAVTAPKKVVPVVENVVDEPAIVVTTDPVVQEEEKENVVAPEATK